MATSGSITDERFKSDAMDGNKLILAEDLIPETAGKVIDGDRPSRHGQLLGEALALMAELGRKDVPTADLEPCLTCAFRRGTVPNQTAGTGVIALNCVLRIDRDRFACHHGMKDGEPQRVCLGYVAALLAPHSKVLEILKAMKEMLSNIDQSTDDALRSQFDTWLREVDPESKLDVYQVAREYEKRKPV